MPRFADVSSSRAEWRTIHRTADSLVHTVRVRMLRAFDDIEFAKRDVLEGVAYANVEKVVSAVDLLPIAYHVEKYVIRTLTQAYARVFESVTKSLSRGLRKAVDEEAFTQANPFASLWAANHSAALITNVTNETRAAVRVLVTKSITEGIDPRSLARRIEIHVGLTQQQTLLLMEYSLDHTPTQTVALAKKLRRRRAMIIARNETMKAANAGQFAAWQDARSKGLISPDLVKTFIVTPDDRLCSICEPLDGEQVGVGETFSFGLTHPPVHVLCRCTVGLSRKRKRLAA